MVKLVYTQDSRMGLLSGNVKVINWVNSGKPKAIIRVVMVIPSQAAEGLGSAEGVETRR